MSRNFSEAVFDPRLKLADAPLLVEASAGTGKTYSIQNVYLRLILEGRRVQEILVVTFTEAATEDLRRRLREALASCRDELEGRPPAREVAGAMDLARAEGATDDGLQRRIHRALQDFSEAAIFTIHAFCKRVLDHYAFECGYDPESTLLAETSPLLGELCRDWWRRNAYGAQLAAVPFAHVGQLQDMVKLLLAHPDANVLPAPPHLPRPVPAFNPPNPQNFSPTKALRELMEETAAFAQTAASTNERMERFAAWLGKCGGAKWSRRKDAVEGLAEWQDILQENMDAIFAERIAVAREIEAAFRAQMREKSAITYDAMLYNVRDVLRGGGGETLKALLRAEFSAALMDEFQDTDGVQYEIFRLLFAEHPPLVMVGDPKQSIYAFRSGDIFTYYRARSALGGAQVYSLQQNHRSAPKLVAAVNALFDEAATPEKPAFKTAQIRYAPVEAALSPPQELDAPFEIWTTPAASPDAAVYAGIAAEIRRLQAEDAALPLDAFAVLVLGHREAEHAQRELEANGLPALRQAVGNIFETEEARNLQYLFRALLEPRRLGSLLALLASGWGAPCSRRELFAAHHGAPPAWMTEAQEALCAASGIWPDKGFLAAFAHADRALGIRRHLAAQPDGVRRATHLGQLLELLNQAERARRLTPGGLLRHLTAQTNPATRTYDEDEMKPRISDDAPAVKIMTIFKSKGLEFPVVFLPDLYTRKPSPQREGKMHAWRYHDGDGNAILDFRKYDKEAQNAFRAESMQEDIRLAYVACTRAKTKTILVAHEKDFAGEGNPQQAIAYLFSRRTDWADLPIIGKKVENLPDIGKTHSADLPMLGKNAPDLPMLGKPLEEPQLPFVDKTRGHTSFSALMEGGMEDADHDEETADAEDTEETEAAEPAPTEPERDAIFDIPGGARLGTCWHEMFEKMDFTAPEAEIRAVVDAALDAYRICPRPTAGMDREQRRQLAARREAVHRMVRRTLDLELPGGIRLRGIPLAARRMEMEFQFSLNHAASVPLAAVADILEQHWNTPARNETFIHRLRQRGGGFPRGFLTGFIDLVFLHEDRFHIVDWKSNRLDGRMESFHGARLRAEMAQHGYYLQYLLYLTALHGFLSRTLRGYAYDTHIGACHYLFLRAPSLHTDRPAAPLIHALAVLLA